ncbi:MAG: hypothetical protein ACK2U3_14360 [Anaerolineales bacterium]
MNPGQFPCDGVILLFAAFILPWVYWRLQLGRGAVRGKQVNIEETGKCL